MSQKYKDKLPELLSPKVDIIFKMIFGDERNKDLTIKFISAVLGYKDGEIEDITFFDPHLKREHIKDKLEILDIKAKLSNGNVIDIEMQARSIPEMRNRISYYKSNMITEQIGSGSSYSELKPVKSIIVADFDFIPESKKCHTIFSILEVDEHFPFNDLEEIHVLSLKKLPELKEGNLLNWLKFISSEKKEDFMRLAKSSPVLERAVEVLEHVSSDESNRMLYEARLKEWRDNKSRIDGAWADGIAVGRAEGRAEGEARMNKLFSLLEKGMSLDEAKRNLGL